MEQLNWELYGGDVKVFFDDPTHRYKIEDRGIIANPTSVTTYFGVINKPALVPWAVNQAVDTLQARLFSSEAHEPEDIEVYLNEAKSAHLAATKHAADVGTAVHNWLEEYWHSRMNGTSAPKIPFREDSYEIYNGITAGVKWIENTDIEPIYVERPLYSRQHNAIGRCDLIAKVNGKTAIVDWKTSKGLYSTYFYQTAAYLKFYEEETGIKLDERWLIKLDKDSGEYESKRILDGLDEDYEAFLSAVNLYRRERVRNKYTPKY